MFHNCCYQLGQAIDAVTGNSVFGLLNQLFHLLLFTLTLCS